MVASKYRVRQIIKPLAASFAFAFVMLPARLFIVSPTLDHFLPFAIRTPYPLRPPQLPHRFIATFIIYQTLNPDFHRLTLSLSNIIFILVADPSPLFKPLKHIKSQNKYKHSAQRANYLITPIN
jgi:hypothetical protein